MTTTEISAVTRAVTSGHVHEHEESGPGSGLAASASVALDIGAGRGALVIYPEERFRDREIEISRRDADSPRVHTGVHERSTQAGSMLTAIFGSLAEGDYTVWEGPTTAGPTITVSEGMVAELHLS
jgi:hypothetical protein